MLKQFWEDELHHRGAPKHHSQYQNQELALLNESDQTHWLILKWPQTDA